MYVKVIGHNVGTVYAVCNAQGRCDFEEFMKHLEKEGHDKKVAAVVAVLQEYLSDPRKRFSTNVRRDVLSVDGTWELRRKDIRLLCFDGPSRSIIVSHAYEKRSNDIPRKELSKLKHRFRDYKNDGISIWKDAQK